MRKTLLLSALAIVLVVFFASTASAHRSGCHRWHSCPSDTGSYTCGDAGYPCQYPTYPASGGVVYPPNGYYKDCYDCPLKKVPSNSSTSGLGWACNTGYEKVGQSCQKIQQTTTSSPNSPSSKNSVTGVGSRLTSAQINSILALLQSFGAEAKVIANVKASLGNPI